MKLLTMSTEWKELRKRRDEETGEPLETRQVHPPQIPHTEPKVINFVLISK